MVDEPRVARLHLVPAGVDKGDEVPVAELGDTTNGLGGTDAGPAAADLGLIGRGAESSRSVRVAVVEQHGGPASGGSARVAAVERPGAPSGPASVGSARVAAVGELGPASGAAVRHTVDMGRFGAPAQVPVRVARLGPADAGRPGGERQRRRVGTGSAPDLDAATTDRREPDSGGRSPTRRSRRSADRSRSELDGARTRGGALPTDDARTRAGTIHAGDARPGAGAGALPADDGWTVDGPSRAGLDGRRDAPDPPVPSGDGEGRPRRGRASGERQGRRPPGPKQIDPDADPVAAAKDICLDLLTARPRTKHELADALRRRGVPDEAAATALDRFGEVGLIDDAAFAGLWVRSRQRTKGLARRALAVELRHKGVDEEVAGEALAEVDADAEEQRARELVHRKLRTVAAGTPEQRTSAARRLVGMLARKGYPGGIAYRVVREALAAHGADVDELGSEPPEE